MNKEIIFDFGRILLILVIQFSFNTYIDFCCNFKMYIFSLSQKLIFRFFYVCEMKTTKKKKSADALTLFLTVCLHTTFTKKEQVTQIGKRGTRTHTLQIKKKITNFCRNKQLHKQQQSLCFMHFFFNFHKHTEITETWTMHSKTRWHRQLCRSDM